MTRRRTTTGDPHTQQQQQQRQQQQQPVGVRLPSLTAVPAPSVPTSAPTVTAPALNIIPFPTRPVSFSGSTCAAGADGTSGHVLKFAPR